MSIVKARILSDAYMVCLHHVFATEAEEVMGLLIGQFDETDGGTVCDVFTALTLRRSDKRKDRVEISPEMLFEAQQKTEQLSRDSNQELHIVGWYHSHPHMTVWPSLVDLQTQAGYQQMDSRFIGIIFSVFTEDKKNMSGHHHLTCFQAENKGSSTKAWERVSIPFDVIPNQTFSNYSRQAIESLIQALFEEQYEVLQESREKFSHLPLVHFHNSAVMVRNVCALNELILGPLVATLEKEISLKKGSITTTLNETAYLKKLIADNNLEDANKCETKL